MIRGFVFHPKDNVSFVSKTANKGDLIVLSSNGEKITSLETIPFAHKIAIEKIPIGSYIYKYGEKIGKATQKIIKGEHVHVHNIYSLRVKQYNKEKKDVRS